MKILVATGNQHKAKEIRAILADERFELLTLSDFPELEEVVEDGRTLEENAVKKALSAALGTKLWTIADDTGLEVEALDGRPGVFSARFAGPDCDFAANCRKLLDELDGVPRPKRGARFRTVVALSAPEGTVRIVEGRLDGEISESPAGENGFGYDPVFFLPDLGKTLAELSDEEKNRVSHRGRAIAAAVPLLKELSA